MLKQTYELLPLQCCIKIAQGIRPLEKIYPQFQMLMILGPSMQYSAPITVKFSKQKERAPIGTLFLAKYDNNRTRDSHRGQNYKLNSKL